MAMTHEQAVEVARSIGLDENGIALRPVAGGDTSQTCLLETRNGSAFVKFESSDRCALLAAEADGLAALSRAGCVRVPQLLGHQPFEAGGGWLALEALKLRPRTRPVDRRLGHELAMQHRDQGEMFGWHRDNYLGPMPQSNDVAGDWSEFFRQRRLAPQIQRLVQSRRGPGLDEAAQQVLAAWTRLGADHDPEPSLLHGDLWAGNAAALSDGTPVIYDPAVHYGDRECDLAMADLFGGFSEDFFRAYREAWPLPGGWRQRRAFYQLYHVLNHANLFGGSYVASAEHRMRELIGST